MQSRKRVCCANCISHLCIGVGVDIGMWHMVSSHSAGPVCLTPMGVFLL